MPYCWKCGAEIEEAVRFCHKCGAPVRRAGREEERPWWEELEDWFEDFGERVEEWWEEFWDCSTRYCLVRNLSKFPICIKLRKL